MTLLDANGDPIPVWHAPIRSLQLIDRAALPGLPAAMEARLLVPSSGDPPSIVIHHPESELHVEMPLTEMADLARYVEMVQVAVLKQAMGEVPEADGYRMEGG